LVLIGFACSAAWAQDQHPDGTPSGSAFSAASELSKTVMPMDERLRGDHWTVEARDEIAGTVSTATSVVTEVTPTDTGMRVDTVRPDKTIGEDFRIYDRSWNAIRSGAWQYFPYDGNTAIQTPLTVGKTWTFQLRRG
jgi:hypothetical protein